jgi:hypothetical protein
MTPLFDPSDAALPYYCNSCHRELPIGKPIFLKLVDLDPGDPEVGPEPDICNVLVCQACFEKGAKQ